MHTVDTVDRLGGLLTLFGFVNCCSCCIATTLTIKCTLCDSNVIPNLKTTGIQATRGNDLRIFKTRFKYDLHKFFRYLPRKNQEIFQRFGTRKSTLQHVYQCTEVQNNGGQHSADKTIFQCKWTMKENH